MNNDKWWWSWGDSRLKWERGENVEQRGLRRVGVQVVWLVVEAEGAGRAETVGRAMGESVERGVGQSDRGDSDRRAERDSAQSSAQKKKPRILPPTCLRAASSCSMMPDEVVSTRWLHSRTDIQHPLNTCVLIANSENSAQIPLANSNEILE